MHTIEISPSRWATAVRRGSSRQVNTLLIAPLGDPPTPFWWALIVHPRLHLAIRARSILARAAADAPSVSPGPIVRVRVRSSPVVRFGYLQSQHPAHPKEPADEHHRPASRL